MEVHGGLLMVGGSEIGSGVHTWDLSRQRLFNSVGLVSMTAAACCSC